MDKIFASAQFDADRLHAVASTLFDAVWPCESFHWSVFIELTERLYGGNLKAVTGKIKFFFHKQESVKGLEEPMRNIYILDLLLLVVYAIYYTCLRCYFKIDQNVNHARIVTVII